MDNKDAQIQKDLQRALINKIPTLWALKYRYIKGDPITFTSKDPIKHRPWQVDLLNDQHPNKVIRKSRQLGMSEMGVTESLAFLDCHPNTKAMYTFPRKEQAEDFSNTRITPIFTDSEYLKGRLDPKLNNVRLKKLINGSVLFLRSAWGSALGEGVDIDLLSLDEYDRMAEGIELAFKESMKSSRYHLMRRWSTPTIPGRGIDLLFSKSDQRVWMHRCTHCGTWQMLSIEDNILCVNPKGVDELNEQIDNGSYKYVCKKCKMPLNRWGGQYVSKFPSRHEIRGYHISQLDAVWITADEIMRNQFTYKQKQLFYNYVIGIPYASEGLIITDQDVLACVDYPKPIGYRDYSVYTKIVAGIDWGYTNWIVVLGLREGDSKPDILDIDWVADNPQRPLSCVEHFTAMLRPYDPDFVIADNGYGADRNTYLIQQFPGRVYACDWDTNKTNIPLVDSWNDKGMRVRVDKTVKMKRTLFMIKSRAVRTFANCEKLMMLIKHLKNVRTLIEEDEGIIYETVTRVGDDHTACALTYATIALDRIQGKHKPNSGFNYDFM